MRKRRSFARVAAPALAALLALPGSLRSQPVDAPPDWAVADATREAYGQPLPGLEDRTAFLRGRTQFRRAWIDGPRSAGEGRGLGPLYNRLSCVACHPGNGRGKAPDGPGERMSSMLVRLSLPGAGPHGAPRPHPAYGDQLNEEGVPGLTGEGRARVHWQAVPHQRVDGVVETLRAPRLAFDELAHGPLRGVRMSARVGPPVYGLGLLEAVPEAALRDLARRPQADGVRGRLNEVWDPVAGRRAVGRFGWKANTAGLEAQVVQAAHGDLGLTSSVFPLPNCAPLQAACRDAARAAQGDAAAPELDDALVRDLTLYLRQLAVPAPRGQGEPTVERGRALFGTLRCGACHRPTLPQPAGRAPIAPYTDLLLHDMGPGLADGRPDFRAGARHWRTPPLWGIGLVPTVNEHSHFLHDGRARNLREAVLWHGGEAAASRRRFEALDAADQAALLAFLGSL